MSAKPPASFRTPLEDRLANAIKPLSHSPLPVWGLSSLFLGSSFLSPISYPHLPPFIQRFGFGLVFAGAGYVCSTGDVRNGSGITTAWCLTYLFLNGLKSIRSPRSPLSLSLTGATTITAAIFGSEYFWFQNWDHSDATLGRSPYATLPKF